MPSTTHAELAAQLLRDAALLMRTLGQQNPDLAAQMQENSDVFEQVATLVENDPTGTLPF